MTEKQKRSALQGAPLLYCNLLFFGFAAIFFHDMVVGTNQTVGNPIQLFGFLIMVEQRAFLHILVCVAFAVGIFEQQRGQDGAGDHHDDDRSEEDLRHQSQCSALVGNNQSDLTTADHADTDLFTLMVFQAAQFGTQSASQNFGQHSDNDQQNREENEPAVHFGQVYLQTDAGKEDWRQQQVGKGSKFDLDILGFRGGGDD